MNNLGKVILVDMDKSNNYNPYVHRHIKHSTSWVYEKRKTLQRRPVPITIDYRKRAILWFLDSARRGFTWWRLVSGQAYWRCRTLFETRDTRSEWSALFWWEFCARIACISWYVNSKKRYANDCLRVYLYSVRLQTGASHRLCIKKKVPSMSYPDTVSAAFEEGPTATRRFAPHARWDVTEPSARRRAVD